MERWELICGTGPWGQMEKVQPAAPCCEDTSQDKCNLQALRLPKHDTLSPTAAIGTRGHMRGSISHILCHGKQWGKGPLLTDSQYSAVLVAKQAAVLPLFRTHWPLAWAVPLPG